MPEIIHHIPQVPVREVWEWKSNVLEAYDGTEQRIALRGAPRTMLSLSFVVTNQLLLTRLWNSLLIARSDFYVPEFQYATRTTQAGTLGRVYFDPAVTDVRVGEYLYLKEYTNVHQVTAVYSDGCDLDLTINTAKNLLIAPMNRFFGKASPSMNRYAVSQVAEMSLEGVYNRSRSSLIRPDTSDPLTYWNSVAVLDCRPLATSLQDVVLEDNILVDNEISLLTLFNKWDEAKVQLTRQYLVERYPQGCTSDGLKSLDWWRHFLQFCRGSAKKFWLPLYHEDYPIAVNPPAGTGAIVVSNPFYFQLFVNKKLTHLWIQISSASWTHRTKVTSIGSVGSNLQLNLQNDLPDLSPITRVELLLPCRLDGDSVEWEHYARHSIVSLKIRTAENV